MKNTKKSLVSSVIALILCFSMLLGTTYAWFTDSASSIGNIIQSGNLDIEMHWSDNLVDWNKVSGDPIFTYDNWEPGYTEIKYIKVVNAGNLSFKWKLNIEAECVVGQLAEVIDVYYINPVSTQITSLQNLLSVGILSDVIENKTAAEGVLLPANTTPVANTPENYLVGETMLAIAFHMDEAAGNKYQGQSIGDGFTVSLLATQLSYESDAFGNTYDENAVFPNGNVLKRIVAKTAVNVVDNKVAAATTMSAEGTTAEIPAGVKLNDGVEELTLTIAPKDESDANVILNDDEIMASIDVHIDGVAEDNEVVMAIKREALLAPGLNMGNYRFYHVEDGNTVEMKLRKDGETPVHNDFDYDPATGDVVLYIKSFSEIALISGKTAFWQGEFDGTWYTKEGVDGSINNPYIIANADQLAALGAIVGGMTKDYKDNTLAFVTNENGETFKDKYIKLVANIDMGFVDEMTAYSVFYPIGYYNSEHRYKRDEAPASGVTSGFKKFEGTFDGNGNTIMNIYQNTWEMKGDHNWYDAKLQYYRDGMGIFGKVYGGTVKNLTVRNFTSDGEITTTGVIAAYADCGATFENIAIFDCNPRVYNIGNGGIVGCVGWYAKDEHTTPVTFRNITVDNTNKISALWGSWDVACGGIVGQYYPTSGQSPAISNAGIDMVNCHFAAQIDVYNDVCANYQYYAYRYAGMMVGSIKANVSENGYVYPDMTGITASHCTVNFGDWNDYYYCELVANSLASYTHDHQMSRLEQVESVEGNKITYLDGTVGTVPASGSYNYVVVKAKNDKGEWVHGDGEEYATCYHFVDGKVWNHEDAGKETVDSVEVLKEDKQLVYREFNQLFTGDGWGVTSKGITDFGGITNIYVEIGREDSVDKFIAKNFATGFGYTVGTTIKIGDLFDAIDESLINDSTVFVAISPATSGDIIYAEYTKSTTDDWRDGTITFLSGCVGNARIIITDYVFCKEAVIESFGAASSGTITPDDEF